MTPEAGLRAAMASAVGRPVPQREPSLAERLDAAVERAVGWLLGAQVDQSYWCGELQADTTLESDYILFQYILGRVPSEKVTKLANYIRKNQLPDGGWNTHPQGPPEINATVKAYFALRLVGDSPDAAHMERARQRVHELGGLEVTNSYTRFYMALVGALGWDLVPAVPPELMLLPQWFFMNVYEMSSWTRAIVIPMAILYALKPGWRVPKELTVEELFKEPARRTRAFDWDSRLVSWRNFFLFADRVMKLHEKLPWKPLRKRALEISRRWLFEHMERSEGIATIYPAMANSVLAMLAMGHSPQDEVVRREESHLVRYEIEDGDTLRMQPCVSPVWDTAIAMVSLEEAGLNAAHPALLKAADWLLRNQIAAGGDWQVKNRDAEPGGWAFEFRNDFFPDVDDTAFVLMALRRVAHPDRKAFEAAIRRGTEWLLSMQNRDGGWGAFDRDNSLGLLNQVPFADHNAMLDPSTADVTARALECLGLLGWPADHAAVQGARAFLDQDQTSDGAWYGRWGVNYIYGTSGVLRAMQTIGVESGDDCRRAAAWLRSVQNPDGGFGEAAASYDDPSKKGQGKSTASQTAWALIGLLAASGPDDPAVARALEYLVRTQRPDGSWDESEWTGTGFPRVFYLKYHLYRNSFPLYALARYRNLRAGIKMDEGLRVDPAGYACRKLDRGNG